MFQYRSTVYYGIPNCISLRLPCYSGVCASVRRDSGRVQSESQGEVWAHQPHAETRSDQAVGGAHSWHPSQRHVYIYIYIYIGEYVYIYIIYTSSFADVGRSGRCCGGDLQGKVRGL
jgi:hypothetical protein